MAEMEFEVMKESLVRGLRDEGLGDEFQWRWEMEQEFSQVYKPSLRM